MRDMPDENDAWPQTENTRHVHYYFLTTHSMTVWTTLSYTV